MRQGSVHVAVVGAGIVGMSCALWLQEKGFVVSVIDGNPPGSGTSYGNACTIADYGCIPVNHPGLIRQLPKLVFGHNTPLSVNPRYALTHLPWLFSFLRYCRQSEVDRIIASLGCLLRFTHDGLNPLIHLTRSAHLLSDRGCLYAYQFNKSFQQAQVANRARAEQGVRFSQLNSDEIRDLEPHLKMSFSNGLLFETGRLVLNPQTLTTRYFDTFQARQGQYEACHAKWIAETPDGIEIHLHNGRVTSADKAVICSGAFSTQITGTGVEKLPLDTERGYHIQYRGRESLLTRPVSWAEAAIYATPMNEGLRLAGTVEIAGLHQPKNQQHIDFLKHRATQMFDITEAPESDWLGFRPTLPDALPVIGPSTTSKHLFYAFGHQHIGLTLAGITGKLISERIAGETPTIDLYPFRANRFS